jgi:hypothetical protein
MQALQAYANISPLASKQKWREELQKCGGGGGVFSVYKWIGIRHCFLTHFL